MHVASTWSDKSWIEALLVIGRHNKDTALLRANTIKSIKETRERNLSSASLTNSLSLFENSIDIFEQNDGIGWCLVKCTVKTVVVHSFTGEVQIANVEFESTGNGKGE